MTRVGTVSLRLASYCAPHSVLQGAFFCKSRGGRPQSCTNPSPVYALVRPIFSAELKRLAASPIVSSINDFKRTAAFYRIPLVSSGNELVQ